MDEFELMHKSDRIKYRQHINYIYIFLASYNLIGKTGKLPEEFNVRRLKSNPQSLEGHIMRGKLNGKLRFSSNGCGSHDYDTK